MAIRIFAREQSLDLAVHEDALGLCGANEANFDRIVCDSLIAVAPAVASIPAEILNRWESMPLDQAEFDAALFYRLRVAECFAFELCPPSEKSPEEAAA